MITRTKKSLIFTAVAGMLSAAALTASALPASAASVLWLYGNDGNQEVICTPPGPHGVQELNLVGVAAAQNNCGTRVWLHQFSNGSGWSYCISPNSYTTIPSWADFPAQLLVSSNSAYC